MRWKHFFSPNLKHHAVYLHSEAVSVCGLCSQKDEASSSTLTVCTSAPLHILKPSHVMYTHVSSSFLCITLRGLAHAPFPLVHSLFLFFCFFLNSVFISHLRGHKFGNVALTRLQTGTRARGQRGERACK